MDASTKEEETHDVLKKYNKFRKQKLQAAKKPWEGPTHKKFSQYLDQDSSSSSKSEEEEEEEANDSNKENSSQENEGSSTEMLESDNESLILPAKTLPMEKEQPRNYQLSDSEPEDPEEVRKYQEKLKARRSRVTISRSNYSLASVRNRTINQNRTTNLTIQPHLLDFSSSEDEETIRGGIKDSDEEESEYEIKPATVSSPKRRKVDNTSPAKTPVRSPSNRSSHNSSGIDVNANMHPIIQDIYPLPEVDTPCSSGSDSKAAKLNRISTPKPTDLKASKLLNRNSMRRSKNLALEKQVVTATKSSPSRPAANVTPKKAASPVKEAPKSPPKAASPVVTAKTKGRPRKSVATSTPTLSSKTPSLTAQHLASTKPKANETASPSKFFKSKSTTSEDVAKAPAPTVAPLEAATEEQQTQQDVYDNLEYDQLNQANDVPLTSTLVTPEKSTGRRTRSNVARRSIPLRASLAASSEAATASGPTTRQGSKAITPRNKSLTTRSKNKDQPVQPSPIKKAAASPQNKQQNDQQTNESRPQQEQQAAVIPPTTTQPSTAPSTPPNGSLQPTIEPSTVESPLAAYGGVRFNSSQYRLADAQDPVQSCLIHQTPQINSILWKLLPGVVNWSRTRGETYILVLEGCIELESKEYPRGHMLKLPPNHTFSVKNSESAVAMFQSTEYL